MSRVLAIDPGPKDSAFVLFDERILDHGHWGNEQLLRRLRAREFGTEPYVTAIEQISMGGMVAGVEIFDTCFWAGRFAQASRPFALVKRTTVKRHLCGKTNVNDKAVRAALFARFGGFPEGFTGHKFSALAVAVTWADQQQGIPAATAKRGAA